VGAVLEQLKHTAYVTGAATTVVATFDSSVAASSLIVVVAHWSDYTPVINSVLDDQGGGSNTYTVYGTIPGVDGRNTAIAYALNVGGGSALTVTVTFDEAEPNRALSILEYSGVLTSAALDDDSSAWAQSTSNPPDPGTITPTEDNELLIAAAYCNLLTGFDPATGFSEVVEALTGRGFSVIHEIQTSATERTAFWTNPSTPSGTDWSTVALSFKVAAGGASVTPPVGNNNIAGYAPVLAQIVTPGVANVDALGYAPTVTATALRVVTPGAANNNLVGYAPTVTAGGAVSVTPGVGNVDVLGYVPIVTAQLSVTVTPGVVNVDALGYAPTVVVTLPAASISMTMVVAVGTTFQVSLTPAQANIDVLGYVPTADIAVHKVVTPGAANVDLLGYAPVVTAFEAEVITVPAANVDLATFAPSVDLPHLSTPGVVNVNILGYAPIVGVGESPTPGVVNADVLGYAPTASVSVNVFPSPGVANLNTAGLAPTPTVTTGVFSVPVPVGGVTVQGRPPDVAAGRATIAGRRRAYAGAGH
jgi:hypothetical protein